MIRGDHPRSHVTLWSLDHVSSRSNGKRYVSFSTKPIANKNNRVMDYNNTDFTIWKRGRRPWRWCMKICILRIRRIKENPLRKFCYTGDGREKVNCDVLMKTCNIFSKIMVILDMNGIKVLTIFTVEYHTTFFQFILKDWACIPCFAWVFGLFTLFLHLSSTESGWKTRRMNFFYFVNQFLVCMFGLSHSTHFFNCFFNF